MPYSLNNLTRAQGGSAAYNKRLSICLEADGFSFAEVSADGALLAFGRADGRHAATMTDVTREVRALFAEVGIQPLSYKNAEMVVMSDENVWVPDELYEPAANRQYMRFVGGVGLNPMTCHCAEIGATAVFSAAERVVTAFKVAVPGVTVLCQHAKLVQLAPRSADHHLIATCWRVGRVDVAAFKGGRYLFGNTLSFANDAEAKYRVLEVLRCYGMESEGTELMLMGQVDRERFAQLRPYFPVATLFNGTVDRQHDPVFKSFHAYRHALILM